MEILKIGPWGCNWYQADPPPPPLQHPGHKVSMLTDRLMFMFCLVGMHTVLYYKINPVSDGLTGEWNAEGRY